MSNPNRNVAGVAGSVGVLVSWLLGRWHVALSAEDGAAISTGLAAVVLWIGRDGLRGILRTIWRGNQQSQPPAAPPGA